MASILLVDELDVRERGGGNVFAETYGGTMGHLAGVYRLSDRELDLLWHRVLWKPIYSVDQSRCPDAFHVWSRYHGGRPRGDAEETCEQFSSVARVSQ